MKSTEQKKAVNSSKLTSQCKSAINDFAKISEIVGNLRKTNSFSHESENNPFVIWYAPTKNVFSAHLMGIKISEENFDSLIESCKIYILEMYNEWAIQEGIIESPVSKLNQVVFKTSYSKMTKNMLIDQIQNLENKLNNVLLKIGETDKKEKNDQAEKNLKGQRDKSKTATLAN